MSAAWNKRNPDKMRAAHKRWLANHPERAATWLAEYKKQNADKMRATKRRWNAENKQRIQERRAERKRIKWRAILSADLKCKFGITIEDYEAMSANQNHACAICGIPASELRKRMSVDHEHETGRVRALLCNHCNTGLGFFRENTAILNKAITYLNEHTQQGTHPIQTVRTQLDGFSNERGAIETVRYSEGDSLQERHK